MGLVLRCDNANMGYGLISRDNRDKPRTAFVADSDDHELHPLDSGKFDGNAIPSLSFPLLPSAQDHLDLPLLQTYSS